MIPDNAEKIIMTKEDYDRNVEQLLLEKINAEQEIERLRSIINELEKWIKENNLGKYRTENVIDTDELLDKLQELKGSDK